MAFFVLGDLGVAKPAVSTTLTYHLSLYGRLVNKQLPIYSRNGAALAFI